MDNLKVPHIKAIHSDSPLDDISSVLDTLEKNFISVAPWPAFKYKPEASFAIAYNNDCIAIKYYIREKTIKAEYRHANDPVYKDSCVEFFIAFDGDTEYYNVEFNCIGTCLLGYGTRKNGRKLLPEQLIEKIKRQANITNTKNGTGHVVAWELTCVIPLEIFIYHELPSLKGRRCNVNFFKCGDDLPEPHFLAWQDITAAAPDFHLRQFFGAVQFL